MTVVLAAIGALLIAAALVDLGWTTVAAGSGAGPLTARIARRTWRIALAAHARRRGHAVLSAVGVGIVFAVLAMWLLLLVAGWSLVFASSEGAVRERQGAPADGIARVYFAGYSVFTLGNGDYRPGDDVWQLATVAASGTGLVFVTLAITYLVPVASAVAQRREVASYIASLGRSPAEILTRAWTGDGFGSLGQHLVTLAHLVHGARQRHLTYPVLHYFHSADPESAAAPSLARLSQAVDLLRHAVVPQHRPDPAAVDVLDRSIASFLETLAAAYIQPFDDPLPAADQRSLRRHGIPTVSDCEYEEALTDGEHRRRLLAAYLEEDGWQQADVVEADCRPGTPA